MSLLGHYLLPHPPIILPEIGRGEERKISETTNSFNVIGKEIGEKAPDTIILITPHGTMFEDAIALTFEDEISGDLNKFGAPAVAMNLQIHKALTSKIYELASKEGIPTVMPTDALLKKYNAKVLLDHGAMVPLYYINKYHKGYNLVHITYAPLKDMDLYRFGIIINQAVEELKIKAVCIASGDLSHKLKDDGPYGFSPYGETFDLGFLQYLQKGDVEGVFNMDRDIISNAGECGRSSMAILLGTLEGKAFKGEILSYEGTFGVGYGVMRFNIIGEALPKLAKLEALRKANLEKKNNQKDPYVKLARESLTTYLSSKEELKGIPEYVTDEMKNAKGGVFVSLKKHGNLRGCIGTMLPTTSSIAEEIIRNAVEAGLKDPRFTEVIYEELLDIDFSVDVLTTPIAVTKEELDPKIYGVILTSKAKRGLLLPDLEGVNTVEEQLSIALGKAGIMPNEDYTIQSFTVIRHKED